MSKAQGYAIGLEARGFVAEADELRRLEAENQNLTEAVWDGNRQIEQLREAKAELLEALKIAKTLLNSMFHTSDDRIDAAIQKHGGQA